MFLDIQFLGSCARELSELYLSVGQIPRAVEVGEDLSQQVHLSQAGT